MATPAKAPERDSNLPPREFETASSFLRYSRSMPWWNYELQQKRHMEMLFRALNLGTSLAFLGSGCSRNFGLPDWEGFAKEAILQAWVVVHEVRGEDSSHKRHYQEKVIEFSRQLRMHEMRPDERKTFADGAGLKREGLESLVAAVVKKEKAKEKTKDRPKPSGDRLRFILGACKRICDWCDSKLQPGELNSFLEFLKARFDVELAEKDLDNEEGVHRKLLALPLHRFVTSNYDLILEKFLAQKLGQPCTGGEFDRFLKEKAFTQADRDSEKLARFAAGMSRDSRNMVFHCHGWCRDAKSMIVTEENYQEWYFGDADGAGPDFRQSMELLVGSHPIVFVGFGMNDPDLLMALRTLSAIEPERKAQRALFAIMKEQEAKERNAIEHYFDQYGVHVIGYKAEDQDPSRSLADFLEKLNQDWKSGRESWLLKPKIHGVIPPPKGSKEYWHYELAPLSRGDASRHGNQAAGASRRTAGGRTEKVTLRSLEVSELPADDKEASPLLIIKPTRATKGLDSLLEKIRNTSKKGCLIVLVGDGGTGKSWSATRLLRELLEPATSDKSASSPKKCFFWSSYYADDALTGIIRANSFFKDERQSENEWKKLSRLERFSNCLKASENVLVFDGMERFLLPHKDQPGIGVAANSGVSNFLEILKKLTEEDEFRATVVLTTRLVPDLLAQKVKVLETEFYSVEPITADEATSKGKLGDSALSQEEWAALVALLGGHRYAMDLAALWPKDRIGHLIHYLGNVGMPRRVERMIELTLCRIESAAGGLGGRKRNEGLDCDECDGRGPYQSLMKRMAVFMGPIKRNSTFVYCHELAKREWGKNKQENKNLNKSCFPEREEMWNKLIDEKLLFRVELEADKACVMHAVVREFIFHNFHQADARKLASFTQIGFTSGADMVDPGKKGAGIIEELFCELRRKCRDAYKGWEPGTNVNEQTVRKAQSLCQEAFGVLRSRMQANTVARWGSFSKYIHYLVRMGDLARAYCGMSQKTLKDEEGKPAQLFWNHCDSTLCADPEKLVIHERGPLFGDELAWLYHELGLALYHEGAMIDCLAIWEQGLEVNKILDGNQPGQYTFQGYCNLGAACIQYGRLPRAREYIQTAKEISLRGGNKDKDHIPRLDGYLALVRHLRGDLLQADAEYDAAIKLLRTKTSNARAECIFMRHHAHLKLKLKDKDKAESFIRSSRAKAEEGHFPDLVAQARLSEGHLFRTRTRYQDAIREYKIALSAARQYGMRGLEADALSEMARLALDLGDTETARTRAIKSLQIANELHLGLRQTHGLVVLGKATAEAGQRALGVEYLRQARELAERQHYDLRAREAEEELHRLGAMGSIDVPLQ